ncbi:MAG: hypothetical protein E7374_01530 [Clostridiales bacterium]|nr:hypothetical protein [Clostridiales bacterium]
MNYIVPMFRCLNENQELIPYVLYEVENDENLKIEYEDYLMSYNLSKLKSNFYKDTLAVNIGSDCVIFLFEKIKNVPTFTFFKYNMKYVSVSLFDCLTITVDGEKVFHKRIKNVEYSKFEIVGSYCLIYFLGVRNFVVALKGNECVFADFYDEQNVEVNSRIFMKKIHDSLNHGKVMKVENGKHEDYLIYLDDDEMKLKKEFVPLVFLDCIKCKNLKYANEMLNEEIKQDNEKNLMEFFEEFDMIFPFKENYILIKKNTLAGIFKFEVKDNKISNIIQL